MHHSLKLLFEIAPFEFSMLFVDYQCGKQCLVCERKTVDVTKPNGLSCTYCGLYFHSECSSTFSKVSLDVLSVVKKVCTPRPS